MIGTIVIAGGLLAAGFASGRVRSGRVGAQPASAAMRRTKTVIVVAVVAFPVITLMLAKLFQSDVLGWIFGLTLMAGMALLPCAAVFYLGLQIGSRGRRARQVTREAVVDTVVLIERGSVHASDDAPSRTLSLAPDTTLRALVALATADSELPHISGGKATWVVESSGAAASATAGAGGGPALGPVAVHAAQWAEARFLVAADISIATHFGAAQPMLHLRYRAQKDPEAVLAALLYAA